MLHRVELVLAVLRGQLSEDELLPFIAYLDDPIMFTSEVIAAHVSGRIDLSDDIVRGLVSTMDLPLEDQDGVPDGPGPDRLSVRRSSGGRRSDHTEPLH